MKKVFLLILLSFFISLPCASAAIINFDDLPTFYNGSPFGTPGDYGTSFRYGDVTFKTCLNSHLLITSTDWDRGFGVEHSLPNKLSNYAIPELRTTSEITILFDSPVQDFNFWLTGLFRDTTVNAYDKDGNLLETFVQTYPQTGPLAPGGIPWVFIMLQKNALLILVVQVFLGFLCKLVMDTTIILA